MANVQYYDVILKAGYHRKSMNAMGDKNTPFVHPKQQKSD